jgi:hypothetical protein
MSSTSALRRGSDAGAVASGIGKYAGRLAIALIDASIIGASAVALSTAYAIGDVLSLRHSLHRKPSGAKGFYAVYCGLIGCRRARPDARRTARALDQCGAGPRRSPIAERHGVPAAALQRQAVGPASRNNWRTPPAARTARQPSVARGVDVDVCSARLSRRRWRARPVRIAALAVGYKLKRPKDHEPRTASVASIPLGNANTPSMPPQIFHWPNEICRHRTKQTHHEDH